MTWGEQDEYRAGSKAAAWLFMCFFVVVLVGLLALGAWMGFASP